METKYKKFRCMFDPQSIVKTSNYKNLSEEVTRSIRFMTQIAKPTSIKIKNIA